MSGSYIEYKKCTKQFIDWIIHTSKLVNPSCLRLPPTLSSLLTRVSVITSSSTTIKTDNVHVQGIISELGSILKVGAKAIKLREMVHNFHLSQSTRPNQRASNNSRAQGEPIGAEEYNRSNDDHKFCIDRLKECYRLLMLWLRNNQPSSVPYQSTVSFSSASCDDISETSDNIFRVLADEHESLGANFQDLDLADSITEYSTIRSTSSPTPSTHSAATTCATDGTSNGRSEARTIDQIDEDFGDLRLTLICLMLDMMRLADKVTESWRKVRSMEGTFYAASLETTMAIKVVSTLQAQLQLKYPSIVEVRDLFSAGLQKSLSTVELGQMFDKFDTMNEYALAAITLSSFSTGFKPNTPVEKRDTLVHRRGFFGAPFLESHFPVGTSLEDYMRFLPRELADLYNNHWDFQQIRKLMPASKDFPADRLCDFPLTKIFLTPLIQQFETGAASITGAFAMMCWMKSIQVLEDRDHLLLTKHNYLCRKYMRSMDEKWAKFDPEHAKILQLVKPDTLALLAKVRQSIPSGILGHINVYFYNPILSCSALIEKLLLNFRANVLVLQDIPFLPRAICHLYRVFVQEGYLPSANPVMEDFISAFRSLLYFGKDHPKKGDYFSNYLLSENFSAQSIATIKSTKKVPEGLQRKKTVKTRPGAISDIYQVVYENDLSRLINHDSMDFETMLEKIGTHLNDELLEHPLLTLDILPILSMFKEIASGLFHECKDTEVVRQLINCNSDPLVTSETGIIHESILTSKILLDGTTALTIQALLTVDQIIQDLPVKDHLHNIAAVFAKHLNAAEVNQKEFYLIPQLQGKELFKEEFGPNILKMDRNVWIPAAVDKSHDCHIEKHSKKPNLQRQKVQRSETESTSSFGDDSMTEYGDDLEAMEISQTFGSTTTISELQNEDEEDVDVELDNEEDEDDDNDEVMNTFFTYMDTLQLLEVNISHGGAAVSECKDIHEEIRTAIKKHPEIVTRFEPMTRTRYQTLLDFFVCGVLQDQELAEYIIAQGGLLLRTPNCPAFGYSHLQLACMDGIAWSSDLLIKAGQGADFDYRDKSGNSACHYAAMENHSSIVNAMIYAGADLDLVNLAGQRPGDMIRGNSAFEHQIKSLTGKLVQQEQAKMEDSRSGGPERRTAELQAKHHTHSKKVHKALKKEEEQHMKKITPEDIERGERAKQELFAMLDEEERLASKKVSKKNGKSSANTNSSSNIKPDVPLIVPINTEGPADKLMNNDSNSSKKKKSTKKKK